MSNSQSAENINSSSNKKFYSNKTASIDFKEKDLILGKKSTATTIDIEDNSHPIELIVPPENQEDVIKEFRKQIQDYQKELTAIRETVQLYENQRRSSKYEGEKTSELTSFLIEKVSSVQNLLESKESHIEQSAEKIGALYDTCIDLQDENEYFQSINKNYVNKIEKSKNELIEVNQNLLKSENYSQKLQNIVLSKENENKELDIKYQELDIKYQSLLGTEEVGIEYQSLSKKYELLNATHNAAIYSNKTLKDENNKLSQIFSDKLKTIQDTMKLYRAKKKNEITKFTDEIKDLKDEIKKSTIIKLDILKAKEHSDSIIEDLKEKNINLQRQLSTASNVLKENEIFVNVEVDQIQDKSDILKNSINDQQTTEIVSLNEKLISMQQENDHLMAKKFDAAHKFGELEKQIALLKNSLRNTNDTNLMVIIKDFIRKHLKPNEIEENINDISGCLAIITKLLRNANDPSIRRVNYILDEAEQVRQSIENKKKVIHLSEELNTMNEKYQIKSNELEECSEALDQADIYIINLENSVEKKAETIKSYSKDVNMYKQQIVSLERVLKKIKTSSDKEIRSLKVSYEKIRRCYLNEIDEANHTIRNQTVELDRLKVKRENKKRPSTEKIQSMISASLNDEMNVDDDLIPLQAFSNQRNIKI